MARREVNTVFGVLDWQTVVSITMISFLISLLSLSIPIAAQTLVNLIAFGKLMQPVIVLSALVFIFMFALGALNLWQMVMIEVVQQKLMVKISLNLSKHFTHLSLDNFSKHHAPALVNRFFEIVSINKALAGLLLYGINLGLQLFLGLLLILIYHPLFLWFDVFIIISILLTVLLPFKKALASAEQECAEKHEVGAWLEEILINRYLFRFNNYQQYVTEKTDKKLVSFLLARNTHFKQLIKHQLGFYILSALASSLLLGLGGYLVIQNQLSLGQLVAAEIILGALIYSFKRFGLLLENYYDLISSERKIDAVLRLPIENLGASFSAEVITPIQTLQLSWEGSAKAACSKEQPLLLFSENSDACRVFVEEFFGFKRVTRLKIEINEIPSRQNSLLALRKHSLLIAEPEWFVGSILDNLVLQHTKISPKFIVEHLKDAGLAEKILNLPEGLNTVVYEWEDLFTSFEMAKFMILRAMLLEAELIVIDRAFDRFDQQESQCLLDYLLRFENRLLIFITQRKHFNAFSNQGVIPS